MANCPHGTVHSMRVLPLLAAVAILLSGCSGSPGDADGTSSVTTVTNPADLSALNGTDQGFHLHDYWGGNDRLTVLDQQANVQFALNGGDYGEFIFFPDEGAVVPQGTSAAEVVVTWHDNLPGMYGDVELWVKTQADAAPESFEVLSSGSRVTFPTVLADADLPHQVLSAWEFALHIKSPANQPSQPATGNARSFNLVVNMVVEVVRGLDLPLFPAHPDHWQNATELPLIDGARGDTLLWVYGPPGCGFCSGGIVVVDPDAGRRVPVDAAAVEVTMTYSKDTPTGLALLYHGADAREWMDAPVSSDDGGKRIHVIPVEGNGDGPYAAQSLWEFWFRFDSDTAGGAAEQAGPYAGVWELSARVLKQMPA